MLLIYFIVGVLGAFVVAGAASTRGHSAMAWFFYGLVLWPVALIHVLVLPRNERAVQDNMVRTGAAIRCPHCAELVQPQARICRFCQRSLIVDTQNASDNSTPPAVSAELASPPATYLPAAVPVADTKPDGLSHDARGWIGLAIIVAGFVGIIAISAALN